MAKKQQESKVFALDYQIKGQSFVYGGGRLIPLEGQDKVAEWIAKLPTDAVIITEQGGATDGPIYRLVNRGVEVHYVPTTYYENLARTEYGISGKKEDAKVLWRMFHEGYARNFHRHTPADDATVRLSLLYNTYTGLIADRVAAQNRVTATYTRSAWFVAGDEESIQEFIDSSCAANPAFAATTTEEESYKKELEKLVLSMPIYRALIEPITGIGPRIGAAMIVYLKQAERFFDPDNPQSMSSAQKRWGEYSGLDGEAFTSDLLATRRTGGSGDIGVPGLKAVLHLTAEQFVRQQGSALRSVYDIRKWKEYGGMLDILLNSKTETSLVFDTKNGNGEGFGIGPVELAHKRAARYLKQLWDIKYWFPYAHKFQKNLLPENFDANNALATVAARDIELTLKCIRRDCTLRLARQSYERPPKGGKISYPEWPTVIELGSPDDLNYPDDLRELAIEQMIVDVEQELAEMQVLESKKKNGGKHTAASDLQAKIGRLVQLIEILKNRRLEELPNRGRQLIFESRGIGRPIVDFIDRHVLMLADQITALQTQQTVVEAPIRTRLEELKIQKDGLELQASELQGELRRAQRTKDAKLIAIAETRIAEADLTRRISEVREEIKTGEKELSQLRKNHKKEMDNLISGFKPGLDGILNADPRLANRSKRDRQYMETIIWSVIQHRAEFGLSL